MIFIVPRHSSILCTLPLTEATVSANTSSCIQFSGSGSGVNSNGLADDQSIADQFSDGLSGIGVGDLVDFVRIKPNFAFAAFQHCGRQTLLSDPTP